MNAPKPLLPDTRNAFVELGFNGKSFCLSSSTVTTLSSELDEHKDKLLGASCVSIYRVVRIINYTFNKLKINIMEIYQITLAKLEEQIVYYVY